MRHLWLLILPLGAASDVGDVVIGSALNITRCLAVHNSSSRLVLQECMDGKGVAFEKPYSSELGLLKVGSKCINGNLRATKCNLKKLAWTWNRTTLQLQYEDEDDEASERQCLTVKESGALKLDPCLELHGKSWEDQNGEGAPAAQTWVLLPTDRPQIDILDELKFPLRVSGSYIIDSEGRPVKLVGVNWFGAHLEMLVNNGLDRVPMKYVAKVIKHMGFNHVRMNYASFMHKKEADGKGFIPVPDPKLIAANPELENLSAMEVFDKCVEALTDEGLLVIVNRHMGEAGWCCTGCDGSELWYGRGYTIDDWLESLTFMADRYKANQRVIGIDILNEPRMRDSDGVMAWWGYETKLLKPLGIELADWRVAAAQGAVATWKGNPDALVLVEGILYASLLRDVVNRPMKFAQECLRSRVVYSNHDYHWFWQGYRVFSHLYDEVNLYLAGIDLLDILKVRSESEPPDAPDGEAECKGAERTPNLPFGGAEYTTYERFSYTRNKSVWYLQNEGYAPVWTSEFGSNGKSGNKWWNFLIRYYEDYDGSWCYWALDPVKTPDWSQQDLHTDEFGLFDASRIDYYSVVGWKLQDLIDIQRPRTDPSKRLPVPEPCEFDYESNLEASREPTSFSEFVNSMAWTQMGIFELVLQILAIIAVISTILTCAGCGCFFLVQKATTAAAPTPADAEASQPLNRDIARVAATP